VHEYPCISVMAFAVQPGGDISLDDFHGIVDNVYVESYVIEGPYDSLDESGRGEERVNSRCQRVTDAVWRVINADRTLGGLVFEYPDPPRVQISDVWTRRDGADDQLYFVQASRLDFGVQRQSYAGR